jgi:acetate kinase
LLPATPAVACFDTAFHATLSPAAFTYALPEQWRERWGLRRFGFHGLSHSGAVRRAAELGGRPVEDLRVVSCHLGGGSSVCAAVGGRSVDTTMGFTPLEGLVMATRSGTVDPGLVLWLMQQGGLSVDEVANGLEHASGLAGLYGGSGDLREVVEAAPADEQAGLALGVYLHRLCKEAAAMAAAAGGFDVLAFTGGIGEHQPGVRAATAEGLAFLGVDVDPERNATASGDADVSSYGAAVRTVVVTAREDLEIARQVRSTLGREERTG